MAHYFASDVHLRDDRPERERRLLRWLEQITPSDELFIIGDLCDFWMGARTSFDRLARRPAFQALARLRENGCALSIMAGNHDVWLVPFYANALGARILEEPYDLSAHGLRVRLAHGHRLGTRRAWKAVLEGRAFFRAFGALPEAFARPLDRLLDWKNERGLLADEERHLAVYRKYAAALRDQADLVVIGHVHRAVDERLADGPRTIVLGGWKYRLSYLVIDEEGARHCVVPDGPVTGPGSGPPGPQRE